VQTVGMGLVNGGATLLITNLHFTAQPSRLGFWIARAQLSMLTLET